MSPDTNTAPVTPTYTGPVTLRTEKQAILDLLSKGEENHWQIGVHYNNIVDLRLAEAAGFKSAQEFIAKELLQAISQPQLSSYGRVAKAFTADQAAKYGVTKLDRLLTYEAATNAPPPVGDPGLAPVQVPQKDGTVAARLFRDCSVGDLMAALKQLKAPPQPLPAADAAQLAKMQAALAAALGQENHVVLQAQVRGRATEVNLHAVPMSQLATVLDALRAAL